MSFRAQIIATAHAGFDKLYVRAKEHFLSHLKEGEMDGFRFHVDSNEEARYIVFRLNQDNIGAFFKETECGYTVSLSFDQIFSEIPHEDGTTDSARSERAGRISIGVLLPPGANERHQSLVESMKKRNIRWTSDSSDFGSCITFTLPVESDAIGSVLIFEDSRTAMGSGTWSCLSFPREKAMLIKNMFDNHGIRAGLGQIDDRFKVALNF